MSHEQRDFKAWAVGPDTGLSKDPLEYRRQTYWAWRGWCAALAITAAPPPADPEPSYTEFDGYRAELKTTTEKPADFPHLRKVTIFDECAAVADAEAEYCEQQRQACPQSESQWSVGACTARIIRDRIRILAKVAETPPLEVSPRVTRPGEEIRRNGSIGVKK